MILMVATAKKTLESFQVGTPVLHVPGHVNVIEDIRPKRRVSWTARGPLPFCILFLWICAGKQKKQPRFHHPKKKQMDNPRWLETPIHWAKNFSPSQATRVYYIHIYIYTVICTTRIFHIQRRWGTCINNHPQLPSPNPWATIVSHWGSWICVVKVSIWRAMVLPRNAWLNGCLVWTVSRFEWRLVGW